MVKENPVSIEFEKLNAHFVKQAVLVENKQIKRYIQIKNMNLLLHMTSLS